MHYVSFKIRNFKGIKDTTINFNTKVGAGVFAFVGLNESGKTTILEAIHSFSPDSATSELLGGEEGLGVPFKQRVPRHRISDFTGDVSVTATLDYDQTELEAILSDLAEQDIYIDPDTIPSKFTLERHQRFEDGDFCTSYFSIRNELKVKTKRQKVFRKAEQAQRTKIRDAIFKRAPKIAYFPTFIFEFPEKFFLTNHGDQTDQFYRSVFQDILDYDGRGHTIERDIVRRVRNSEMEIPWLEFLSIWSDGDERAKVNHVIDRASAAVTRLVFGKWNEIFGEDTKGKEILISYGTSQGEECDENGQIQSTNRHNIWTKFQIKDGTRRFDVNDRSLGFRWFFSFMLFTQFRVARAETEPLLFLFDEPASNLHAAAQQKLLDSFPEIAKNGHVLGYTTHSHYMIEPKWLEQTFIVTNREDAPKKSVLDDISLEDESLDIRAQPYRAFVNENPSQTSYFQPILDRLKVAPSRFDITQPSIVLEGKSDYYILRYATALHKKPEMPLIPGVGAGAFGPLAALAAGWNLNFLFVLDGDKQGKAEKERYVKEYGIDPDRIYTIDEFLPSVKQIEDLLDADAKSIIRSDLGLKKAPTKNQIRRFFQERLASDNVTTLGSFFTRKSKALLKKMSEKF